MFDLCEFGACGDIGSSLMRGKAANVPGWCGQGPAICALLSIGPLGEEAFKKLLEKIAEKGTPMHRSFKHVEKLIDCVAQFAKDDAERLRDLMNNQQNDVNPVGNFARCIGSIPDSMSNPF
jgi:hypothetical protein